MSGFSSISKIGKRLGGGVDDAPSFSSVSDTTNKFHRMIASPKEAQVARTAIQEEQTLSAAIPETTPFKEVAGELELAEEVSTGNYIQQIGSDRAAEIRQQAVDKWDINLDTVDDKYITAIDRELVVLADGVGLPDKALSLGGRLNVFVKGARQNQAMREEGQADLARASGLTELGNPADPFIIVTQRSAAHEWFHNLDQYFSALDTGHIRKEGDNLIYDPTMPTGTATSEYTKGNGMRKEVFNAWRGISDVLRNHRPELEKRFSKLDDPEYWVANHEVAARAFEKWLYTIKQPGKGSKDVNYNSMHYPTAKEMKQLSPKFEKLFKSMKTQEAFDPELQKNVVQLHGLGGSVLGSVQLQEEDNKSE